MRATLSHIDIVNDTIKTFWFRPDRQLRFTAGQFTELTLPHPRPDDRGIKHWFTLSSSPSDELVAITTRIAYKDGSSFKTALQALQPGDEVDLAEAMGDFVLPKLLQSPIVFVAGGIGITPFHSIASWLKTEHIPRNIRLLHAVRTEDDIIFPDTFQDAHIPVTTIVSQPSSEWGGEQGTITAEKIIGIERADEDTLIYLSGPEPMLENLEKDLLSHGIKNRQIVTDFFPGYSSL